MPEFLLGWRRLFVAWVFSTLFVGLFGSWVAFRFWHGSLRSIQTVDINLLSAMAPFKLSEALHRGDAPEVQRVLDSSYGLFGMVVTDCASDGIACPDQRIRFMTRATWRPQDAPWQSAEEIGQLAGRDFDVLRDPPPIHGEWLYPTPRDVTRRPTGKRNVGRIIGRVYYLRSLRDQFWLDFQAFLMPGGGSRAMAMVYDLVFLSSGLTMALLWGLWGWRARELHRRLDDICLERDQALMAQRHVLDRLAEFEALEREIAGAEGGDSGHPGAEPGSAMVAERIRSLVTKYRLEANELQGRIDQLQQDTVSLQQQLHQGKSTAQAEHRVVFVEPSGEPVAISALRQQIGLDDVLQGVMLTHVVYSDRYLRENGAQLLVSLLDGPWLAPSAKVEFRTMTRRDGPTQQQLQRQLDLAVERYRQRGLTITTTVAPVTLVWRLPLPHMRLLLLAGSDGKTTRVVFDKGLDFVEQRKDGKYKVREQTYVAVSR